MKKIKIILVIMSISITIPTKITAMNSPMHELVAIIDQATQAPLAPTKISTLNEITTIIEPIINNIQQNYSGKNNNNYTITPPPNHHQTTTKKTKLSHSTDSIINITSSDKGKEYVTKDSTPLIPDTQNSKQETQTYSENDMWTLLHTTSPLIYDFGQKNTIAIDDLLTYSHLLQKYHIEPTALVEFIKTHNNLTDTTANSWAVDFYEKIQTNDKDSYQTLKLEIIKALFDKAKGIQNTSTLNSTHIDALHNHIAGQQTTLNRTRVGALSTILFWLATGIGWIIQSQVTSGNGSPGTGNGTAT